MPLILRVSSSCRRQLCVHDKGDPLGQRRTPCPRAGRPADGPPRCRTQTRWGGSQVDPTLADAMAEDTASSLGRPLRTRGGTPPTPFLTPRSVPRAPRCSLIVVLALAAKNIPHNSVSTGPRPRRRPCWRRSLGGAPRCSRPRRGRPPRSAPGEGPPRAGGRIAESRCGGSARRDGGQGAFLLLQ